MSLAHWKKLKRSVLLFVTSLILFLTSVNFGPLGHQWITVIAFEQADNAMAGFYNRFFVPVTLEGKYMLPDIHNPGHAGNLLAKDAASKYRLLVLAMKRGDWDAAENYIGWLAHYCGDACSPTQHASELQGYIDNVYDALVEIHFGELALPEEIPSPVIIPDVLQFFLFRCDESTYLYKDQLVTAFEMYGISFQTWGDLWALTAGIFQERINQAIIDTRDVWYTAWDEAGRPTKYSGGCRPL